MISCRSTLTRTSRRSLPIAASPRDTFFMERALRLAERGLGRTTPNPVVGAVVVAPDGTIVGQGAHLAAGQPHAEIIALDAAGERARGATLYCTLEPCAHTGRTAPCVERIVGQGITRVVAAIRDPNPRVNGGGFSFLRAHGVETSEGLCASAAAAQNLPFFTWTSLHRPFVTLKVAVSIDGFVGRPDTRVKLTGAIADRWSHRQRAQVDAIAVGSNTMLIDDPQLTARGAFRYRPLTRVIFDWRGRVPRSARVFSTLDAGPVIMVGLAGEWARRKDRQTFEQPGIIVDLYDTRDLSTVVRRLADREIQWLLVEGGPTLHDAFHQASLVDSVRRIVTPKPLGGGVIEAIATSAVPPGSVMNKRPLGEDELIEVDVHRFDRNSRGR